MFLLVYDERRKGAKSHASSVCLAALASFASSLVFVVSILLVGVVYEHAEPPVLKLLGGSASPLEIIYSDSYEAHVREYLVDDAPGEPYQETGEGSSSPSASDAPGNNQNETPAGSEARVGVLSRSGNPDMTTGRLGIWESAFQVWMKSPVIGVSHRNLIEFAEKNVPDAYISVEHISTMHNVFLDVLVSQGVVGLALFVVFLISLAKRAVRLALNASFGNRFDFKVLVATMVSIGVSALFYSEILYINTISSVVFWMIAGYVGSSLWSRVAE